jgi:ABC-type nitrate/sulfonate/bicarbonate transport system substrate-binding protein
MKTRLSLIAAALAIAALVTAAPASANLTPTLTLSWEPTPISSKLCVWSERSLASEEFAWSTCGVFVQP